MESRSIPPWYKQFWPWFLIGLLLWSFAMGTTFLVVSIRSFDGMVQEDYYKHGRAINMVLAKQQLAAELGLEAELVVDDLSGDVAVTLEGEDRPEALLLELIFPTEDDRDHTMLLHHQRDGHYVGQLERQLQHRWYLHLQPVGQEAAEWRLTGEARFPEGGPIMLTPGLSQP